MSKQRGMAFERAISAFRANDFLEAQKFALQATVEEPRNIEAWRILAMSAIAANSYQNADTASAKFAELQPCAQAFHLRAMANRFLGRPEAALEFANKGLAIEQDNRSLLAIKATVLDTLRRFDEAFATLEPALADEPVTYGIADAFSTLSPRIGRRDQAVTVLERLLEQDSLSPSQRPSVLLSLAGHYDALGSYDKAFHYAHEANSLKLPRPHVAEYAKSLSAMIEAWSPDKIDRIASSSNSSELPVYIVGMPRSGTSLVEQIIASHPAAFGANERFDIDKAVRNLQPEDADSTWNASAKPNTSQIAQNLMGQVWSARFEPKWHLTTPEALRSRSLDRWASQILKDLRFLDPAAQRITDKNPMNFLHLGLVSKLFPNARVIHCRRDPLDTGISCYMHNLVGPHMFNVELEMLGNWTKQYQDVMEHWNSVLDYEILEVQYEDLVTKPESSIREIIDFLELPWDERCLEFHTNVRSTLTPSADQVRRPVYTSSVGRWKHYEPHLAPLIEALR